MNKRGRVIWAVDPFAEDMSLQKRTAEIVDSMLTTKDEQVEPVGIIMPNEDPTEASKIVAKLSAEVFKHARALPPAIFQNEDLSLGTAVAHLVRHSKQSPTNFIAVGTQAKNAATRFLVGSFAETLILKSDFPTLVVGSSTKSGKIKKVVYPTDLTEKSTRMFPRVLQLAIEIGASVELLHCVISKEAAQSAKSAVEKFSKVASEAGVKVEANIQVAKDTIDVIVADAENAIIAMVSRSESVESHVLGSVTRQVIKRATCPIYVFHPH